MVSPRKLDDKQKRLFRRKNHFAKDLVSGIFRQRIKEGKRPRPPEPQVTDDWNDTDEL